VATGRGAGRLGRLRDSEPVPEIKAQRLGERLKIRRRRAADDDVPRPLSALHDLVLITGFSGAGKSTALKLFEDSGYFCVDNLPPEMIRSLAALFMHEGAKVERAAVAADVRLGDFFDGLVEVMDGLEGAGVRPRILFLEADERTLLSRFQETRRRHPLTPEGSVADGIAQERARLAPLRERAEHCIDTTGLTAAALRKKIAAEMLPAAAAGRLAVTFYSFGHKHGPPRDADLAFDVRFLPNPHWEDDLRPRTGLDSEVVAYIDRDGQLGELYARLIPLLEWYLPQFVAEGKAHLTVAIGCTGGRHRSVAVAERLAEHFDGQDDLIVEVAHRDLDKPSTRP
jgi:RNase adapter protein RapZ